MAAKTWDLERDWMFHAPPSSLGPVLAISAWSDGIPEGMDPGDEDLYVSTRGSTPELQLVFLVPLAQTILGSGELNCQPPSVGWSPQEGNDWPEVPIPFRIQPKLFFLPFSSAGSFPLFQGGTGSPHVKPPSQWAGMAARLVREWKDGIFFFFFWTHTVKKKRKK